MLIIVNKYFKYSSIINKSNIKYYNIDNNALYKTTNFVFTSYILYFKYTLKNNIAIVIDNTNFNNLRN